MKKILMLIVASLALSACVVPDMPVGVTRGQIYEANTPDELVALGGVQVLGDEISTIFSGRTFVEPNQNWVWDINADGSQQARDAGGEWADAPGGTWQVIDDTFCRENEDLALKCSQVYRAGPYYRMTEDDGRFALWTMTPAAP